MTTEPKASDNVTEKQPSDDGLNERIHMCFAEIMSRLIAYEALRPLKEKTRAFADMRAEFERCESETHAILQRFFDAKTSDSVVSSTGGKK